MGTVGQTEQALHQENEISRKRQFPHNGSPMKMFQNHHNQEGTSKSKQQDSPVETNPRPYISQALLIPDEECLVEAKSASFDIIGLREGFHIFGGDVYITGLLAKIYLTTYRVSLLDPSTITYM
jgi:hypothetical protein